MAALVAPDVRRSQLPLAPLLAAALVFVGSACVSGDDAGPDASSTATTVETVAVSSPAGLTSYRYSVEVQLLPTVLDTEEAPADLPLDEEILLTLEGERINPDREHVSSAADLGFLQIEAETISIGAQRWLREGSRPWVEGGSSPLDVFVATDFRPAVLFGEDAGQYGELARQLGAHPSTEEEVNGLDARRFEIDEKAFYELFQEASVLPPDLDAELRADIWLERERGVPIRLELVAEDEAGDEILRLEVNLTDLDSEDIEIEAPD